MPHTLTPLFITPTTVHNDVDYLLTAENVGAGVYTADINISSASFNTIVLKYTLDANRQARIKVKEILQAYSPIPRLTGIGKGQATIFEGGTFLPHNISALIRYNGAQNGVAIEVLNRKSIRGGLDYIKFATSNWINNLVSLIYPTVLPIKRIIDRDEYFCFGSYISFYSPYSLFLDFEFFNQAGTLIDLVRYTGSATHNITQMIDTFNNLVIDGSWGVTKAQVFSFKVFTVVNGTRLTQSQDITYILREKTTQYPLRSFLFLNSLGAYDVLTFSGEKIAKTKQVKQEANININANYTLGESSIVEFNQMREDTFEINSGFIPTSDWLAAYQDFIHSEDIYEMVKIGSVDAPLPIKLEDNKFIIGQDNLTNSSLTIEYKYRFENKGFSNLLKV